MAEEVLKIHINPQNRAVSVTDERYLEAWTQARDARKEEIKAKLREQIEKGKLSLTVSELQPGDAATVESALTQTPEQALNFRAHTQAVQEMQSWSLLRGIGIFNTEGVDDHGQRIVYIDDPNVPFLGYEIEKVA